MVDSADSDRKTLSLEEFDIDAERGFLCKFDADEVQLPEHLRPIEDAGRELPARLLSGRVRSFLESLPELDLGELLNDGDFNAHRMAMVRYSFLVQAYVWGQPEPPDRLPRNLARPICALATQLGQRPLLPYSSYVLDNWGRFDRSAAIDLSNIYMLQHFADGMDESWFVLIHVAIEARAGAAIALIPKLLEATSHADTESAIETLSAMVPVWSDLNAIFDRMPEFCDPYIYFTRVRPYIHGWKDNPMLGRGLIYEGVEAHRGAPQAFRGQTGSQSSIVPTMDALLGVGHEDDPLKQYLDELHHYRPPKHRAWIDSVRVSSKLRPLAKQTRNAHLIEAYNEVLQAVARFRTRHLEYAASYIHKQAKTASGNDSDVGTGGTPFMRYLKKHRDESEAQLLRA